MESFEGIYLDLSPETGKCRIAEHGLGWKPSGGGETFTLVSDQIGAAQWSRAARGYELRILSRTSGVIQLDGFDQQVSVMRPRDYLFLQLMLICRTKNGSAKRSKYFMG